MHVKKTKKIFRLLNGMQWLFLYYYLIINYYVYADIVSFYNIISKVIFK